MIRTFNFFGAGKASVKLFIILVALVYTSPERIWCQPDNSLKKQFETIISDLIGIPVHAKDYKLEYATIHFSDVKIGEPNQSELPHGFISRLSVSCDFMSLLGGKLILNDISLGTSSITLTRNQQGAFFPERKKGIDAENKSFADLPFLNLAGNSLIVKIVDPTAARFLETSIASIKFSRIKDSDELTITAAGACKTGTLNNIADADGQFELKLNLIGKLHNPNAKGTISVKLLKTSRPLLKQPFTIEHGIIKISGHNLKIDEMNGNWGNSRLQISGEIENFDDLSFSASYKADPILLEEFSQAFVGKNGITFSGKGSISGTISGSRKGFNLLGKLRWPSFKIEAPVSGGSKDKYILPFRNASSNYSYNGQQITFANAEAEIFSGRISGNVKLFYNGGTMNFVTNLTGSQLRIEQFLGENSSQQKTLSGPIDAMLKASGDSSGLTSMNGSGNMSLKNGHYQAPPVITPLLAMVNLREFASGDIHSGQGTFALQKGVLHTSDLLFIATAGKAYYRGQVGLDTSLQGKLNLIFSEESVSRSRALQQISLNGKTASIPSNVKGTLMAPSFPGFSAEKLLELGIKRTGEKILRDILSPRKKDTDGVKTRPKANQPDKILKDLKKIFKF